MCVCEREREGDRERERERERKRERGRERESQRERLRHREREWKTIREVVISIIEIMHQYQYGKQYELMIIQYNKIKRSVILVIEDIIV